MSLESAWGSCGETAWKNNKEMTNKGENRVKSTEEERTEEMLGKSTLRINTQQTAYTL